jgi:acyl-[acyl-carrier-protein]-phospholipid O-acyltransferase/long-chain-fatty-acid--[acyl-carrier-protein] ligase
MTKPLIISRKFAPLFWTQFFAAFNDNFLKNTLVFLIMATLSVEQAASTVTLAGAIFMAPFLFLSALGGQLADKFDKADIAKGLKLAEIGAAFIAVIGLKFQSVPVIMSALFLFGVGSALFGPIKYGILPDHLDRKDLPKANAWIEGATFAAILGGTIVAGVSFASGSEHAYTLGAMLLGFAGISYVSSLFIPKTGRGDATAVIDKNVFRSSVRLLAELKADKRLFVTSLMVSWFWFAGSLIVSILPPLVKLLGGAEKETTVFLTVFAVSIAIGSAVAAWFSAGRIVLLPAVVGSAVIGLVAIDLAFVIASLPQLLPVSGISAFIAQPGVKHIAVDLFLMSFAGAFIAVPTFAALQAWAAPEKRGRAIGANNILNSAFITVGGVIVAGLQTVGADLSIIATILGVSSLVAAVLMFIKLPTSALYDAISIIFRAFHRVEIHGQENLEKAGETPIFALNHVSFLDAPLAMILTDKRPVFAVNSEIAKRWWLKPFLKTFNALPLDPTNPMATRTLIRCVEGGQPLVIFPEGRITITGSLMQVFDGAAMVADKTGSLIVPIKIEGLEKSPFSRLNVLQIKKRLFPKVIVKIMEPVQISIPAEIKGRKRRQHAGAALYKIMSNMVYETSGKDDTILEEVIAAAKEFGMKKVILEDPLNGTLTYGKVLTGARVLGNKFAKKFPNETNLGVLLPNMNGTAVTILGVMSAGKVPAMINFTAGLNSLRSACQAAEVKTILTSRAFIAQAKLGEIIEELGKEVRIAYLDDIRGEVTAIDKVMGLLFKAKPVKRSKPEDAAVILFTSGSEGTPKGVVLSHRNILANVSQAAARIDFNANDKLFNILPVFHSFGLTAGTILPLVSGVPIYMFPKPTDYKKIPVAIYSSNATIIFGTDTFLNGYARSAKSYDFQSIRYIFAGAEPVRPTTRETYLNKFGKRILEGYGVTEAAPVLALNTPMFNKPGTVGKLMPGIEARLEPVPGVDEGGRLFVRGKNIMAGYLRAENPGVLEPLSDGFHDTGDIVTIDDEGFVTIKGRAKRFAKIGGEMISLAAVEAVVGRLWPNNLAAVTNVSDPRKGEKLVLVTDYEGATKAEVLQYAKSQGLTELAVPSEIIVTAVPVLGTGKIDFVGVKNLVLERQAGVAA